MLMDGAFTALLLVICGVSSQAVPPPTDVKVSCQNNQTTVNWDYSKQQPETLFRVNVFGSERVRSFEANTTDHQYDLSHFVWESKEHYLAFLCVSVTAIQGGKQSEAVRSKSFSFNRFISVDIKCLLDFPPVEVDGTERGATVEFKNPFSFYELKRTVQQEKAFLQYTVSSSVKSLEEKCSKKDLFCKLDVTFPDDEEECVTLKGVLIFYESGTSQVDLKETEKFCSKKPANELEIALAITLGFIFLMVLTVAVVLICKVEAWTVKTPIPQIAGYVSGKRQRQSYFIPNPENSSVIIVPPYKSTLTNLDKFSEFEAKDGSGDDSWSRESSQEGECLKEENINYETRELMSDANGTDYYADNSSRGESCASESNLEGESYKKRETEYETGGLLSDANGTDEDSTDDSMKTESFSISSTEEEERSHYDCPHVVQRDMGNGELVIGYTGDKMGL